MASLAKLAARGDALCLPGHSPPIRDPMPYVVHRVEREAKVLDAVHKHGPATTVELVPLVYAPELDRRPCRWRGAACWRIFSCWRILESSKSWRWERECEGRSDDNRNIIGASHSTKGRRSRQLRGE